MLHNKAGNKQRTVLEDTLCHWDFCAKNNVDRSCKEVGKSQNGGVNWTLKVTFSSLIARQRNG